MSILNRKFIKVVNLVKINKNIYNFFLDEEDEIEKFHIPDNLIKYNIKFINPIIFNRESRALIRTPNVKVVRFVNKSPNFKLYVKEDNISFFHKIIEIEKEINNKMIDKYIELINILGEKYQIVNVLHKIILEYCFGNNYTSPFKNNTLLIKYDNNIKIMQNIYRSQMYDFKYTNENQLKNHIIKEDKIVDITFKFKFKQNLRKNTYKLSLVAKQIRFK